MHIISEVKTQMPACVNYRGLRFCLNVNRPLCSKLNGSLQESAEMLGRASVEKHK